MTTLLSLSLYTKQREIIYFVLIMLKLVVYVVIFICLKNNVTSAVFSCSSVLPTFTCLPFYSTCAYLHGYESSNPSSLIYSLRGCRWCVLYLCCKGGNCLKTLELRKAFLVPHLNSLRK